MVGVEGARRAVLLGGHRHAIALALAAGHLGAGVQLEALLGEDPRRLADHVGIVAGEDRGRVLDHGDRRAEPAPDRAELEADHAAADHDEVPGHLGDAQRADVREDALLVEPEERQLHRHGAGGDDHVARPVGGHGAVEGLHLDRVAGLERPEALGPGDLVLLEEELDALGVLRDDVVLALHHAREVEREAGEIDAVLGRVQSRELIVLRGAEERLGGDAPDVDAGAAEGLVELDADDGEAELRGADGGDVAAGAAADDDEVRGEVRVGHGGGVGGVVESNGRGCGVGVRGTVTATAIHHRGHRGTENGGGGCGTGSTESRRAGGGHRGA